MPLNTKLPTQSKADTKALAQYSDADKIDLARWVESMDGSIKTKIDGQPVTLGAKFLRALWGASNA